MHPLNWIDFGGGVYGSIISYNPSKMVQLKESGARFIDFPMYLDDYLQAVQSGEISLSQLRSEWPEFESYYFRHTNDPARQSSFEALLSTIEH